MREDAHDSGQRGGTAPAEGFVHAGAVGDLFPIVLTNTLLNILTLSFYRFWARTRVHQYLWGRTSFLGEPIEYTGTGMELFLGFVIIAVVVLVPLFGLNWVAETWLLDHDEGLQSLYSLLVLGLVVFLTGIAVYRARRYRLSRTLWRGIRGAQTGTSVRYGLMHLGCWALTLVTLGCFYPKQRMVLTGALMGNACFGDRRFRFEGRSGPIYGRFALVWLVALIGSGLAFAVIVATLVSSELMAEDDPREALFLLALLIEALSLPFPPSSGTRRGGVPPHRGEHGL